MVFTRRLLLALVLLFGLVGFFASYRPAHAQTQATITISAEISSALTLTACDTTAEFGKGLTAVGGTPTDTQDQVTSSLRGDGKLGQGIFYIWHPSCPAGKTFLQVESSLPWNLNICATENNGSSNLSVAQRDLGFNTWSALRPPLAYGQALFMPGFSICPKQTHFLGAPSGSYHLDLRFTLRVDLQDLPGTFGSTTIWFLSA